MNADFSFVSCPVCNQKEYRKIYEISFINDILPQIGIKQPSEPIFLYHCLNCDHRYANPQLSDSALELYYTQFNSQYYQDENEPINKLLPQHIRVVKEIESRKSGGTVLEVGCGNGFLLDVFDKSRWRVTGVEPFGPAAAYAKSHLGLNIIKGYLEKNTFPESEKFDVVLLFDVMEHLKQPNDMINLIDYYLKPNGLLVMGTGDISSLNAKLTGRQWLYTAYREHLSFFSKKSMRYLLRNFDQVDIKTVSYMSGPITNMVTFLKNQTIRRVFNFFQASRKFFTNSHTNNNQHVRYHLSFDHMLVIARKFP